MNHQIELGHLQKVALVYILRGKNVFIHGCAGTGKSSIIKYAQDYLHKKWGHGHIISVTASTGVAAINVGGSTIHWFSGIRTGKGTIHTILKRVMRDDECLKRWKEVDTLIIDEISMISKDIFEKLDAIGQVIRECSKPFGGIQLILLGDFFQLTPIMEGRFDTEFCFESSIWSRSIDHTITLTKIFRQTDHEYKQILNRIRYNRQTFSDILQIKSRLMDTIELNGDKLDVENIIKLYPLNKQVSEENNKQLNKLDGELHIFQAKYYGYKALQSDLRSQLKSCGRDTIKLKLNARVMLTYNLDVDAGLCNGSLGTVIGFRGKDQVVVKFDSNPSKSHLIDKQKWELELHLSNTKLSATVIQVPLVLAFAASIHKAQGLTFDKAVIDLNKCFAEHQVYVALSRVKSLDGLYLFDNFSANKIKVNKKVTQMFA